MLYPDGRTIKIDDLIWYDEGERIGKVSAVIADKNDLESWGVTEVGIFISCDTTKSEMDIFTPLSLLEDEGIGLIEE